MERMAEFIKESKQNIAENDAEMTALIVGIKLASHKDYNPTKTERLAVQKYKANAGPIEIEMPSTLPSVSEEKISHSTSNPQATNSILKISDNSAFPDLPETHIPGLLGKSCQLSVNENSVLRESQIMSSKYNTPSHTPDNMQRDGGKVSDFQNVKLDFQKLKTHFGYSDEKFEKNEYTEPVFGGVQRVIEEEGSGDGDGDLGVMGVIDEDSGDGVSEESRRKKIERQNAGIGDGTREGGRRKKEESFGENCDRGPLVFDEKFRMKDF
jgi:hypothetical protein